MDTELYYSLKGSGIPMVFQHGLGADSSQIMELLNDLDAVRLLVSDSRGHGKSGFDEKSGLSFDLYADDVVSLMDKSRIGRSVIGGLSMGSGIALNIAARYPERVAALILLRPAWLTSEGPENLQILLKVATMLQKQQGHHELEDDPDFRQQLSRLPLAAQSVLKLFDRPDRMRLSHILRSMVMDCPLRKVPEITVPVLIIGNEDDPLHPWPMAEAWHNLLPDSRLLLVPSRYTDAEGHKREVNRAIQEFMNNITIN